MNKEGVTGPMNVGNPHEYTIKQLAETVVSLVEGTTSKVIYLPLPMDDPKKRKPDITKAKELLQWEPSIQLKEGLTKTIKYFRELDLRNYKRPTKHTAHKNSEEDQKKKKQRLK